MAVIRHVVIQGRVQGVGFRAWTEYTALEHGLEGWVRNRRDGAVEAVFAGPDEAVRAMLAACNEGPPGSRVKRIDQRDGEPADLAPLRRGERFSVLPTA